MKSHPQHPSHHTSSSRTISTPRHPVSCTQFSSRHPENTNALIGSQTVHAAAARLTCGPCFYSLTSNISYPPVHLSFALIPLSRPRHECKYEPHIQAAVMSTPRYPAASLCCRCRCKMHAPSTPMPRPQAVCAPSRGRTLDGEGGSGDMRAGGGGWGGTG